MLKYKFIVLFNISYASIGDVYHHATINFGEKRCQPRRPAMCSQSWNLCIFISQTKQNIKAAYTVLYNVHNSKSCPRALVVKFENGRRIFSFKFCNQRRSLAGEWELHPVELYVSMFRITTFCTKYFESLQPSKAIQWNLSITTTSKIKCMTFDLFSKVF